MQDKEVILELKPNLRPAERIEIQIPGVEKIGPAIQELAVSFRELPSQSRVQATQLVAEHADVARASFNTGLFTGGGLVLVLVGVIAIARRWGSR